MRRVVYDNRRHMASSLRDVARSLLVASRSPTRDSGTGALCVLAVCIASMVIGISLSSIVAL